MKKQLFAILVLAAVSVFAVPAQITLKAEKNLYHCGENAGFKLTVKNGTEPVKQGTVTVQLSQSRSFTPQTVQVDLSKGNPAVISGTMTTPGFLLAKVVDGKGFEFDSKNKPLAGAGFDVGKIKPGYTVPADLRKFWEDNRKQVEKNPVTLTKVPEFCTEKYDYFRVTVDSINQEKSYGFLLIPKGQKKCPILIEIPGAGPGVVQADGQYAEKGVIYLLMNVHKYAPAATAAENQKLYDAYNKKVGRTYCFEGIQSRETFFFRTILTSADKMINYLTTLPQWDGKHLVVRGQSQGGGLSLMLAGMNPRVTAVCAMIPALCDHGAVKASRNPGWPDLYYMYLVNPDVMEKTAAYYDASLLAGQIKVPVFFLCGMIDTTCPPSSVLAAYNNLKGQKQIVYMPETGHAVPAEYRKLAEAWTEDALRK